MTDIVETEKIEMYGVLCINEEYPDGVICSVLESNLYPIPTTKRRCKEYVEICKHIHHDSMFKIFKMKFKEKK